MKKSVSLIFALIFVCSFVTAENKIDLEIADSFSVNENIVFRVLVYDSENNIISGNLNVILEDAKGITKIEKTIEIGKQETINLGGNPRAGIWLITAKYEDLKIKESFTIENNEIAKFDIQGDKLSITNIGNSRYVKTIDIIIGSSLGTKEVDLDIGEEISFRLVAPDGNYNIKVSDGKTTFTKSNVLLTGNVVGILDENPAVGTPVTGGVKPDDSYSEIRSNKLAYVFLLVVIGAAVLLALERNYRKKI